MLSLQLKYFENAAKTQNFSKTAQHFDVPTSTVSASIKKLETSVGVPLFDRSANRIKLNTYGKILLGAVETAQTAFKKARLDINRQLEIPTGEIRLLILANRQKVNRVIFAFKQKYPEVHFLINHTYPENPSEMKNYDVIVAGDTVLTDCFKESFWFREDVVLAVHKNNPLYKKNCISTDELQNQKFICMHKGSSIRNYMNRFFGEKGIQVDTSIECDDPKSFASYLEMNLGIALYPVVAMEGYVIPNIKLIKIDNGLHRNTCVYINKNTSDLANQFSEMLLES